MPLPGSALFNTPDRVDPEVPVDRGIGRPFADWPDDGRNGHMSPKP